MKKGFTLAEVLITLGIIGVVSAMTIPTLIQSYRNHVVETRLKKVYSVMNQAIQRAEADYGAKELWNFEDPEFYNKYYAPYLKVLKTEIINSNFDYRIIYFPDGSILAMRENVHRDYFFYPNGKNFSVESLNESRQKSTGVILFPFRFAPDIEMDSNKGFLDFHYRKGFMPYAYHWDGKSDITVTGLYACKQNNSNYPNWCTLYIMQNGWKIPKDYPFKVK